MIKSVDHSIGDTISEFAAALTRTGKCPDWPGKLMAFGAETPNLSCEAVGLKVVADLVEAADSSSSVFKIYLANFVQALFAIAKAPGDKDDVREMAVEVLLGIVEEKDLRACLNIKEFASELVPVLLELKLKDEDNIDCFGDEDLEIAYRSCSLGEESLNRVASEIGEENVKNIIFGYVLEYLKRDERRYKLVALESITQTAAHLPKEGIETLLDEFVKLLKVQLNDPHQRVRSATCDAIAVLAGNCQPLFDKNYAKDILPLIVDKFDDDSTSVRGNANVAFKIMVQTETEVEIAMPSVDRFVDRFLKQIKPENSMEIREQRIDGMSGMAHLIEKKFMKYYSVVVPVIKGFIVASSTDEERAIRGKALECFNAISQSVGDEMVQADAHEVLQAVLRINGADIKYDDPLKNNILKTFCQMCHTLKGEFVPYLPQVIPNLLKVLNTEPQPATDEDVAKAVASVADGECAELKKTEIKEKVDLLVKKAANKEIRKIIKLLSTFIQVLGSQFEEHLVPAVESLLPLLSRGFNVMIKALPAVAEAFTAARESSDPATRQMLRVWVATVLEKVFKDLIPGDNDAGITGYFVKIKTFGLSKCLRNAGPDVLNAQQVGDICEKVLRLLKATTGICRMEEEPYLHLALFEFIGIIMSFHADLYLQTGAELCNKFIETHLDPNCIPDDRAMALYVFASVLEHLKDKGTSLWPTFALRLVECIGDPDPGVRGAAACGVIQAAKCPQFPAELIQKAATELFALLSAKQSHKKAFLSATYKMIAALGTIVVHRKSCLQLSPEQFLDLWISYLPLKIVENRETLGGLIDLLVQSPEILGLQNENLPKLAAICVSIYLSSFTTVKTDEGIKDFMQKIDLDVISSSVGANFDEKLQKNIKRIRQDSQA